MRQVLCLTYLFLAYLVPEVCVWGQEPVRIQVDASKVLGEAKPVWTYFGYDEPNYTTAANGRKLVGELAALSPTPVSIRVHNLLTTGDGSASLKWGSTNAYTEDGSGKPIYSWTITDQILDTFVNAGAKPFVEIGFMPEALSTHPQPYRHHFPEEKNVFTGWSYPPTDYDKWGALVYALVEHCVQRYGKAKAESWEWEVWNEPDIPYWHGPPEEYEKLYDYTAAAVRRALPKARIGGPASTGPGHAKAAAFLRQFLEHCATGKNAATGKLGAPLDFISFHAKGSPKINGGEVRMGLATHLKDIADGFAIVRSSPKFKDLPIVLSESDPEGCAACPAPQNAYRNGTLYAVYMAESIYRSRELAHQTGANLEGFLTWAFEFEGQPYFAGLRTLATNGIDQPVLNVFRMAGLMSGKKISATSSETEKIEQIIGGGVPSPEVNVTATRWENTVSVMLWNYEDKDQLSTPVEVKVEVSGLPGSARPILLQHYRIDQEHSNSYTAWKSMGSPQQPTTEQIDKLEAASHLQLLDSPRFVTASDGKTEISSRLPAQGISLIQLSW